MPVCVVRVALDSGHAAADNQGMVIPGNVQNGVVVLQGEVSLPEGAVVAVIYAPLSAKPDARQRRRIAFPLVRSASPGSVDLTNDDIAEILDAEDAAP